MLHLISQMYSYLILKMAFELFVGPYEITYIFSQIPFYFFLNNFFSILIFLDSFLMIK